MEKLQSIFKVMIPLLFISFQAFSQNGTVRGTILDGANGETLPFANVLITELGTGTTSDFDGLFSLDLAAGTYTVEFSSLSYASVTVSDVIIEAGKETVVDVTLEEESAITQEVVVTAKAVRNTEAAFLTIQKKAPGILDGITTQAIKRAGDSNVGSAIKRVTGVSVEGGKHVVVRGLGDRYSKTILNGLEIPGLDPDRNSVQLDIFPTNLISNIAVYKSFTPDLPGDFAGGLVNIETKDFPEAKTFNISGGISFNPNMNLKDDFITYQGGGKDWLGMDDGTRAQPLHPSTTIPNRTENFNYLNQLTREFSPIMSTMRESSGVNSNFSLSYGNQINKEKFDIGYTFSGNYRNEYTYYDNAQFGIYFKDLNDSSVNNLFNDRSDFGDIGTRNVLWSTLAGVAIKTQRHKISLSAIHSQNGESTAALINSTRKEFGQAVIEKSNLEYAERSITNFLLKGEHSYKAGDLKLNWQLSPTISRMTEPDIRLTSFEINPETGAYELNPSTAGFPTRTFRNLDENNYAGRIDLTYKLKSDTHISHKLKFGFNGVYKDRDFRIFDYAFPLHKRGVFSLTGNPDELFYEENLWSTETEQGTYTLAAFEPSKTYQAQQQILSVYAMNEMKIGDSFKAIYGLRVEKSENWYTGRKQIINDPQTDLFENRKVLDELTFLPSLGLSKTLMDTDEGRTMNLRFSLSKTLARPTFKEKSIAQIIDRISGRFFIGNIDLEQVDIYNADLRWEYYTPGGQLLSASTFFKHFNNPIELTAYDASAPSSFTPRNVGNAHLFGIELELRRNLGFLSPSLQSLSVSLNTTIVKSQVSMTDNEYQGRLRAQRDGETVSRTRDMVGQSPFIINAGLNYKTEKIEANINYNVQGRRLAIVGISSVPDVYENPFNSLNLNVSSYLDADNRFKVKLAVSNLLDSSRQKVYQSFNAQDEIFERLDPRRTFSLGLSYRIL